jgi:hypothetical protein
MVYNMNLNYVKWLKKTDVKLLPIFLQVRPFLKFITEQDDMAVIL